MRRTRRAVAFVFVAVLGSACASIIGVDDLTVGDCKGGVCDGGGTTGTPDGAGGPDGSPETSVPLPDSGCPSRAGPEMTRAGGALNSFCIDTTEVTIGQYASFLTSTAGDAGPLPPECAKWKVGLSPGLGGDPQNPVSGIDWCDAYLFCQWAGKRLCGKVANNKLVGTLALSEGQDLASDAWYIACTAQGQVKYPYGSTYKAGACNVADSGIGKPVPVKTETECVGGYPGIYDMVGNVAEWGDGPVLPPDSGLIDAPAGDGSPEYDFLLPRGGDYAAPDDKASCSVALIGPRRASKGANVGFRCCADGQ